MISSLFDISSRTPLATGASQDIGSPSRAA